MSPDEFAGCSHSCFNENSLSYMDESIGDTFLTGKSPRETDMPNNINATFPCAVEPLQHNNAFPADTQPVPPAPIRAEQVSQPPVTLREILILKNRMNLLAQKVASFNSEPWKDYVISQAELLLEWWNIFF